MTDTLQKTSRREAREGYARFLLKRIDLDDADIEAFMNEKQAAFEDKSPMELIYTGEYERAITAVEAFTEDLTLEDEELDGFNRSLSGAGSAS